VDGLVGDTEGEVWSRVGAVVLPQPLVSIIVLRVFAYSYP
jgi:hypothetical protein